nr:unnamed protein product [Digitaria exilis]
MLLRCDATRPYLGIETFESEENS